MDSQQLLSVKQRFGIIGNSEMLNRAIEVALRVAETDLSVLITGESGVGKEHFPQIIHNFSARKHGPYMAVNCAAIPEGTVDSELFGHEKGAFTDAKADRKGYFEEANGGTIFLDEVGELPLATQARLLRVLETGEFMKVGASKTQKTNVRVVAATNLNMQEAIETGRFREDLYYRLNTVSISVPALRDRKEDIPLLFRKFASDLSNRSQIPSVRLTDEAVQVLMNYYWNGNIRQLKNVAEQVTLMADTRLIEADTLRRFLPQENTSHSLMLFPKEQQHLSASEREIFYTVLLEMRRDIHDLKQQVKVLSGGNIPSQPTFVPQHTDATQMLPHDQATIIQQPTVDAMQYMQAEEVGVNEEVHVHPLSMQEQEDQLIREALQRNAGNKRKTAQELQIPERTFYRRLKKMGL